MEKTVEYILDAFGNEVHKGDRVEVIAYDFYEKDRPDGPRYEISNNYEVRSLVGDEMVSIVLPSGDYAYVYTEDVVLYVPEVGCTEEDIKEFDPVTTPRHYNIGKYEPRPVIDDWLQYTPLPKNVSNWCAWTLKYLFRAGIKTDGNNTALQDLEKARNYLDYAIERMKENDEKSE